MQNQKKYDNDWLYEAPELKEVINRDPNYKGWYMRKFWQVGKDEVLKLASIVTKDTEDKLIRKKRFTKLLNESSKKLQSAG